jgi:hypothetical protein
MNSPDDVRMHAPTRNFVCSMFHVPCSRFLVYYFGCSLSLSLSCTSASCLEKKEKKTHNCLHIPQGDAAGLISVATARALKSLWPAILLIDLFGYSIREFTSPSFPVYMYDGEGNHKVMTPTRRRSGLDIRRDSQSLEISVAGDLWKLARVQTLLLLLLLLLIDLFGYSIREFTSPSFPVYMYDGEGSRGATGLISRESTRYRTDIYPNRKEKKDKKPTSSIVLNRERYVFTEFMDIKEKRARGLKV